MSAKSNVQSYAIILASLVLSACLGVVVGNLLKKELPPTQLYNINCYHGNLPVAHINGVRTYHTDGSVLTFVLADGREGKYAIPQNVLCFITTEETILDGPTDVPERDQQALLVPAIQPEAS